MEGTVDDSRWYGQTVETPETRIEDAGQGRPIILRQYTFAYNPNVKKKPTQEEILTPEYVNYLNSLLWIDNLELIQHPKVAFKKKGFIIFATCQAKKGHRIPYDKIDQLKPIQTKLQEEHGRKRHLE